MSRFQILISFVFFLFCVNGNGQVLEETTEELYVDYSKSSINTRFTPPKGYEWIQEKEGSFGWFLSHFPLYPNGFPIRNYQKIPIDKQTSHAGILKLDIGDKDLQQCADAWIRLYAEYLWAIKDFDKICFQFTSGQIMSWNDYKNGIRTTEVGDRVRFHHTATFDDSYANFRKYLNLVFNYAGTISLERESYKINNNQDIQTGDFLIKPGSPGHSVFIVGRARNKNGKMVFLLAQSFMPAQDIHIIKNPFQPEISPWYEIDVHSSITRTGRYVFEPTLVKRFYQLMK